MTPVIGGIGSYSTRPTNFVANVRFELFADLCDAAPDVYFVPVADILAKSNSQEILNTTLLSNYHLQSTYSAPLPNIANLILCKHSTKQRNCKLSQQDVPVYLKIDKLEKPIQIGGTIVTEGDFIELEGVAKIDGEEIVIGLPELGYEARLGDVDQLDAVSIRYKNREIQIFLLYADAKKTASSACCQAGGCECYASISCKCGVAH